MSVVLKGGVSEVGAKLQSITYSSSNVLEFEEMKLHVDGN